MVWLKAAVATSSKENLALIARQAGMRRPCGRCCRWMEADAEEGDRYVRAVVDVGTSLSLRSHLVESSLVKVICARPPSRFEWNHLRRWKTITIAVAEEEDAFAESLGAL